MSVHVVQLALMNVNPATGKVFQRGGNTLKSDGTKDTNFDTLPVKGALSFDTQHRVVRDESIPNTVDNPDIKTYLELEDAVGFALIEINQSMIITKD